MLKGWMGRCWEVGGPAGRAHLGMVRYRLGLVASQAREKGGQNPGWKGHVWGQGWWAEDHRETLPQGAGTRRCLVL